MSEVDEAREAFDREEQDYYERQAERNAMIDQTDAAPFPKGCTQSDAQGYTCGHLLPCPHHAAQTDAAPDYTKLAERCDEWLVSDSGSRQGGMDAALGLIADVAAALARLEQENAELRGVKNEAEENKLEWYSAVKDMRVALDRAEAAEQELVGFTEQLAKWTDRADEQEQRALRAEAERDALLSAIRAWVGAQDDNGLGVDARRSAAEANLRTLADTERE